MADEKYDPNLVTRIMDRDAKAEMYLGTQGPVRNLMARPQLFVANAVDTLYTAADNDKLALVRGFLGGAFRGLVYGAGVALFTALLMGSSGLFGIAALNYIGIGAITWAATAVKGAVKAYQQALIMDPLKGAKVGDRIAQHGGALPPPGAILAPLHSPVQDPNIYKNPDTSTKFRERARDNSASQGRNA